jgi:hypothetical protein
MSGTTFNDFFGISVNGFWTDVRSTLTTALKESPLTDLSPKHWPAIVSGIADKAGELFDVDLAWVIVSTWSKYRELNKYADPEKYPSKESNLVPLAKHTLTAAYHPYLEVLFNGKPLEKIVFDITLSLDLEGCVLTIQNGKIMKARTGSCQGKGKIAFKGYVLTEKSLKKIALPGTIELGEGISLRKSDNKQKQETKAAESNGAVVKPQSNGVVIAPDEAVQKVGQKYPEASENQLATDLWIAL